MLVTVDIPSGWRLWHLGQRTTGEFSAQLYNENHTRVGAGGDVFSSSGIARTPQGAIDACLKVRAGDRPQSVAELRPMLLEPAAKKVRSFPRLWPQSRRSG